MSDADDLAHARDFLAGLDRWYDFCRANQKLTPGQLADSTRFAEDAEQARDILDGLSQHADGTLRVIVRAGEDYKLVRWWVDSLQDRSPGIVRDTKLYWESVRLTVVHARAILEARMPPKQPEAKQPEGAGVSHDPAVDEQAEGIGRGERNRRGRPVDADPKADKRLCQDWQAAKCQGMSRDAFARERGITVQNIIDAQHREKYRRRRDAE